MRVCHSVIVLCAVLMLVALPSQSALAERGTKTERLQRVVEGYEEYKQTKQTLADNEAFANKHPEEAKLCFDSMMEVADKHGVERHVYFTDNQSYFRECIEHRLNAQ
jgi:Tfp pilus assembly protein PilE